MTTRPRLAPSVDPLIAVAAGVPDALSIGQRRTLVALVIAVHAAAGAWVLASRPDAPMADGSPAIEVAWLAPQPVPAPSAPPAPPPPARAAPPVPAPPPLATPRAPTATSTPAVAAAPAASAPSVADAVPVAAAAPPAPTVAPAAVAVAPPAPAPAPPPTLSIRSVAYLTPPELVYPPAARRAQEEGRAQVRVLVDATGAPQQTVLARGTGHARLDEAALATAAATRFKPYTENSVPRPFWVVMPFVFELEN